MPKTYCKAIHIICEIIVYVNFVIPLYKKMTANGNANYLKNLNQTAHP